MVCIPALQIEFSAYSSGARVAENALCGAWSFPVVIAKMAKLIDPNGRSAGGSSWTRRRCFGDVYIMYMHQPFTVTLILGRQMLSN